MTISVYPRPQAVQPGTPIRFAVGGSAGPRSQTWTVVSATTDRDVFLGLGERARIMRLSQRRAGWRLEYTPGWARRHPPPGGKRLISQWAWPARSDGGWRRAVSIVVPTVSLASKGWYEPAALGTAFWPAAPAGSVTQFDVLLGMPGHWRLTSEFVGEVGRAALSGAGAVWVVVHYPELSRDGIADLARRRRELLDSGEEPPRTWSAAVADGDGSVVLFDFTSLSNGEQTRHSRR
jgi:hypothetical protein